MTPSGTGVSPDSHRSFTAGQSSSTTCFSVLVDVAVTSPFLLEKTCTRSGASFRFFTISTTESFIHVSNLSCASKAAAPSRPPPLLESSLFPNGSMLIRLSTTAPLAAAYAVADIEILPFHARSPITTEHGGEKRHRSWIPKLEAARRLFPAEAMPRDDDAILLAAWMAGKGRKYSEERQQERILKAKNDRSFYSFVLVTKDSCFLVKNSNKEDQKREERENQRKLLRKIRG
ncbi:hypothetical protein PIB30_013533 [Stylosanthes scabra]|uniref:Uncharacterized protein n=1 Tax=Stylosanthes scabra TaxID=79078 RepID=A0ABU6R5F8_9FABA|nr:hypothetical protein [Stylosanthes scabra]